MAKCCRCPDPNPPRHTGLPPQGAPNRGALGSLARTSAKKSGVVEKFASGEQPRPLANPRVVDTKNSVVAVIFTDDVRSNWGSAMERQLRARVPDVNVIYVDENNAAFETEPILATIDQAERVVAAIYVIPQAGKKVWINGEWKNTVSLVGAQAELLDAILRRAAARTAVVAMGSPYVGADFPAVQTYLCTFSNEEVSEIAAVRALFGEIPIGGHLPVDIPGMAQRGAGIQREAGANREARANLMQR